MSKGYTRKCGNCSSGILTVTDTAPDDVSPATAPLELDVYTCSNCDTQLELRPLAALVMYALMGIIGWLVTLYLLWSNFGNLLRLPSTFFWELLPSYFNIIDIGFTLFALFFLFGFGYHMLIAINGFLVRWHNPAIVGESFAKIGLLAIASGFGLGAFFGLLWILSLLGLGDNVLRPVISGLVVAGLMAAVRYIGASAPLALIFALLWLGFAAWVVM